MAAFLTQNIPPQQLRRARFAVAAMFFANGLIMGAWAPQIPRLLDRHGISEITLGIMILILGLGAVAAMLFSGRLIARFGTVPVVNGFALLLLPVLPLVIYAPNIWLLAPAMALFGAVVGSMDVAMNANAVEVERRLGRAIMSSSHGFWSLGGFAGGTSGAWALSVISPGAQALAAAAIAGGIVLAARAHLRGEAVAAQSAAAVNASRHAAVHAEAATPRKTLLPRELGIWLLGAMALSSMMPEGAVLDWAALYLDQELSAGPVTAGLGFALFSGAMAVMRFAGDHVRDRFGAYRSLRLSGLMGAAGMLLAALAPNPSLALAGFAICGLGVANMVPILFSAAGNYPGFAAGAAISTVTMVGYAGILIAPATIGWLATHIGFRPTYAGLALLLGVVALQARRGAIADHPPR